MRFVSVRELRANSAEIWRRLAEERELVLTSNGRPIAVLSATSGENLEETLAAIRRARALAAVESMQARSAAAGRDRLGKGEIEAEVAAVRRRRRR